MADRPSHPHTSPRRAPTRTERRFIKVRILRRWGPARIAHLLSLNSRPEASCSRSVRRRSAGGCGCAASEQALRALCVVRGDRGSVDGRTEFREPGAFTSVKRPGASRNVSCAAMMPRNRSAPRTYGEVTSSSPITGMNAPMEPSELLTPSPAILTDVRIGYARLSTGGQKLEVEQEQPPRRAQGVPRLPHPWRQPGRPLPRPLRPVTPGPRQHGCRTP